MTDHTAAKRNALPPPTFYVSALVLFTAIAAFAVWLGASIRLDEAQSVWQTSRSLGGVIEIIAKDVHTPLYFILLHYWEILFGTATPVIRLLSLLFYLISIPVVFLLAREAYSDRVAYFAALATAVSPFMNWYGSEARMYSMLFFWAALSHLFFLRIWRERKASSWAGYSVATVLGVATHPFFVLIPVAQSAFFLIYRRRKLFPAGSGRRLVILFSAVALGALAWAVYRAYAGAGLANPALARPTSVDFFNVFSNFFVGFQTDALNAVVLSLWPVVVFIGFTFLSRRRPTDPETTYFALSSLLPIGLVFFASLTVEPIFLSRYLVVALPSLYLVVVYLLSTYRGRMSDIVLSGLIALMIIMLVVEAFQPLSPVKEDWRGAAEYVQAHATPADIFVVSAPFVTYPVEYYYRGYADIATFPNWNRFAQGSTPDQFSEASLSSEAIHWSSIYQRAYVLLGYDQGYEDKIRLYMDEHYQRIGEKTFSPGLTLYVYQLRYI